jgi:chlorobactene glucosyltransferase
MNFPITPADLALLAAQPQAGILAFLGVLFLIALANLRGMRRLDSYPPAPVQPFISVLVPARNEALNIEACLASLLQQDYPHYEVIALDDQSTDDTGAILARLSAADPRLQVLSGTPLPPGWVGKPWACQQLARASRGDLLLFTDADTRHHPHTLRDAASAQHTEGAALLSGMPRQELGTWGERIAIPVLPFVLFALLPVPLARRLPFESLSAAVGQFLLFTRPAYEQIGGHASVRSTSLEDLAFARLVKRQRLPWAFLNLSRRVSCRMYRSGREAFAGISKNLFAVFDRRLLPFAFAWLWLLYVFIQPLVGLGAHLAGIALPRFSPALALAAVGLSLLLWVLTHHTFGLPPANALLYPLTILTSLGMAFWSAWAHLTGRSLSWKGRPLPLEERNADR